MPSTIFDLPEFEPYQKRWKHRQNVMMLRAAYYDGSVYKAKNTQNVQLSNLFPRLYKNIKPLYLPLSRAVDTDVGVVPGKWELSEDADHLEDAIKQIFQWSNWKTEGVLLVHYGAQFGLVALKALMDEESRIMSLDPMAPSDYMIADSSLSLEISTRTDGNETFEWAEIYTPESIRTYRDGVLTSLDGIIEPERPNPLTLIPHIEITHINEGRSIGTPTFDKVMPMLDQVNQIASYLVKMIERHGEPQWAGFNMAATDMQKSGEAMWFIDQPDADIKALVAPVDIPGILSFIKEIEMQVKDGLPELAFDELRKSGQIATQTIELQLAELITKINRIRPNYDDGLAKALRVCGVGLSLMNQSQLGSQLLSPELEFNSERDVIPMNQTQALELELLELQVEAMRSQPITEGENESIQETA